MLGLAQEPEQELGQEPVPVLGLAPVLEQELGQEPVPVLGLASPRR